jgi:hypothetical protein
VTLEEELLRFEEGFWTADGRVAFFQEHLAGDTAMVYPTGIMDEEAVIDSIDDVSPWTSVRMDHVNLVRLRDAAAVLIYRAEAERDSGPPYSCFAASVYVRQDDDAWRLAFHQETPIG